MNFLSLFPHNEINSSDKKRIFLSILHGQSTTRSEAAKLLSIRSTTVSECVGDMLNNQLLTEVQGPHLGRGRPSQILIANPNKLVTVVFQIISQSIHVFCVNLVGNIVQHEQIEAQTNCNNEDLILKFKELYKRVYNKVYKRSEIAGIIFSLSGLFDINSYCWLFSSRWPLLHNLSLKDIFLEHNVPIFISRTLDDELRMRLLSNEESTLLIHWGYGVSLAFGHDSNQIANGGASFGEIGHWKISNEKMHCHCGQVGCLETLTALWSIGSKILGKEFQSWEDEDKIGNIFKTKDLLIIPEVQSALKHIVLATSNVCRIFFPKKVIVTGPFVQNPQLWATFYQLFYKESLFFEQNISELTMGQSSRDLSIIGSAGPILKKGLDKILDGH